MNKTQFDVVVVGGGMVGAALACCLAQQHFRVALLEQQAPSSFCHCDEADLRVSAISRASVDLLVRLEVWSQVQAMRCAPYRRLETWEWPTAKVSFDASIPGLSELGFMVENRVLQIALWQRLQSLSVRCYCPATLKQLDIHNGVSNVITSEGEHLTARLVIGADGAHSRVRQLAGIGLCGWQYAQSCMLIGIHCAFTPGEVTWQQFTADGPRAFLPMYDQQASLVWYDHPARIRFLQSLPLSQLQSEIQTHFPPLPGAFTVQRAASFSLVRRHASRYVKNGVVLVGDAAHTVNPLAGQGVNLGYRDINALTEILRAARDKNEDWFSESVLYRYQQRRRKDNLLMQSAMDLFYYTFSNRLMPLSFLRNAGLMAAERSGVLKKQVLRYALGL